MLTSLHSLGLIPDEVFYESHNPSILGRLSL